MSPSTRCSRPEAKAVAASQTEAIEKARKLRNLETLSELDPDMAYADEISHFLVDEQGDDEHEHSQFYEADGQTPMTPGVKPRIVVTVSGGAVRRISTSSPELEKAFAGSKSSSYTDGGTSARVFGAFLNWLQGKTSPVFVVATAKDVSQLPPELLRKGRWDECFFVDLPSQKEREIIWAIQIGKYGRKSTDFDLTGLAKATDGFTGSEIKQLFIEALYLAFDEQAEVTGQHISKAIEQAVPLGKLMKEEINSLRRWAKGRTRPASVGDENKTATRKLAA